MGERKQEMEKKKRERKQEIGERKRGEKENKKWEK